MTTYKGNVSHVEIESSVANCNEDNSVNFVTNVSINIDNGVTEVFNIGSRNAAQITEGNQSITGSIEKYWDVDWTGGTGGTEKFYEICGFGDSSAQTAYGMIIYPAGYSAAGLLEIQLTGVKFNNYNFNVGVGDFGKESADFTALSLAVGSTT